MCHGPNSSRNWTPTASKKPTSAADQRAKQALTVLELLDDLRERVGQHYNLALRELLRKQYGDRHDGRRYLG